MVLEHGLYNVSSSRQNLRTPLLIDFLPLLRIVQNKVVRASVTLSLPFPTIRIIFMTLCKCYTIAKYVGLHFD